MVYILKNYDFVGNIKVLTCSNLIENMGLVFRLDNTLVGSYRYQRYKQNAFKNRNKKIHELKILGDHLRNGAYESRQSPDRAI